MRRATTILRALHYWHNEANNPQHGFLARLLSHGPQAAGGHGFQCHEGFQTSTAAHLSLTGKGWTQPVAGWTSPSVLSSWRAASHSSAPPRPPQHGQPQPAPDRIPKRTKRPQFPRNEQIRAGSLRVVFPEGNSSVLPLQEALAAARQQQLDLVLIKADDDPPIARITDYGKMMYSQQQKQEELERNKRLRQKLATPKEMHFTPQISDHDLQHKLGKVLDMLHDGYKVMLVVKHRSDAAAREAASGALMYVVESIKRQMDIEVGGQHQAGRSVSAVVSPTAKKG